MAKDDHKFEHCFRDREHNHAICGFPAGMSPSQQKTLLKKHPSWYRRHESISTKNLIKKTPFVVSINRRI